MPPPKRKKEIFIEEKEPKLESNLIVEQEKLWPDYDREILEKLDIDLLRAALIKMGVGVIEEDLDRLIGAYGRLVLELADKLPRYNTIVSDDASGRIPSLVFYETIKKERERKGKSTPRIFFIAGGRGLALTEKSSAVSDFIKSKRETIGKTILITEYIESGRSIIRLIDILNDAGIDFDVISITASNFGRTKFAWPQKLEEKLILGDWGGGGLGHYKRSYRSGVSGDIFFEEPSGNISPHPKRVRGASDTVRETREGIKVFTGELYKLLE